MNFTAEISQNTAFKAYVCRLYSCLEVILHQNLHKFSHWKLKLAGYIVVCRSHWISLFWHKISFIVEYLMHVSSEYIISWVILSLISTTSRTSRILLADVIPWMNKASLALYIARTLCAMPWPIRRSEAVWHCRVRLLWLKIVSVEVESRSQTPSLQLRCRHRCGLDYVCTIFIDDLLL